MGLISRRHWKKLVAQAGHVLDPLFKSILAFMLTLALSMGVISALSGIVAVATDYHPNYLFAYFLEVGILFIFLLATIAAVAIYFLGLWQNRHRIGRIALYILLGLGGLIIPTSAALLHQEHYLAAPQDYVLPAERSPYFKAVSRRLDRTALAEIERLTAVRRRVAKLTAESGSSGVMLRFLDGVPSRRNCSRLDLGTDSGAICVRSYVEAAGKGNIIERFEVWADAGLDARPNTLDLVPLVSGTRFFCPMAEVFKESSGKVRAEIPVADFARCLGAAEKAIGARIADAQAAMAHRKKYPAIPFSALFVDNAAALLGARYTVLEPVSPRAGLISVAQSLLALAYFVLFASYVIETASKKLPKRAMIGTLGLNGGIMRSGLDGLSRPLAHVSRAPILRRRWGLRVKPGKKTRWRRGRRKVSVPK
ncbi:MAG TPA: hypothetical protein VGB57_08215 [Allosphingosinicella sp.]|jgi:hypothetical protein